MRHTILGAVFAISASAVLSFGCGSGASPSGNSFTEVYTRTIQPTCSSVYCHYNGASIRYSALDMSSKVRAYWSLVGQPCMGPNCYKQGTRVVPGDPDNSVIYKKVSETSPSGPQPCGSPMPADTQKFLIKGYPEFSGTELPADQLQLIRDWIQEGAPND